MRHGQSVANQKREIATDDVPLTEVGRIQAKEAAAGLRNIGITRIFHSPLPRAAETAKIIAKEIWLHDDNVVALDDLRERNFGSLEGKPKVHDSEWYFVVKGIELGAEEPEALITRMQQALKIIKRDVNLGEVVLVVGHATSGFYLEQVAKGKTRVEDFDTIQQFENVELIQMTFNED